ncbi:MULTISPECIES: HMA2 domain-containing protein [Photobacterium]|uniref:HMA2 domain-containing protein n=1 Tax=Photobacterium TaxID=657 RepID=UPI0009F9B873|nr:MULTISPECIES: heavy-metal-associated domain-containing protein [Photobacterium]MCG7587450.1 heavy-metal-associated domain-containing protein [Photobacterium sp. OFAV2-7]
MKKHIDTALKLRRWVTVGHHIPGRVRLKYKLGILAHLATFNSSEIERALQNIPAFKNYKLNNATGSLLIEYDASIVKPHLIDALFSQSEQDAEQACYALGACLEIDGANHE